MKNEVKRQKNFIEKKLKSISHSHKRFEYRWKINRRNNPVGNKIACGTDKNYWLNENTTPWKWREIFRNFFKLKPLADLQKPEKNVTLFNENLDSRDLYWAPKMKWIYLFFCSSHKFQINSISNKFFCFSINSVFYYLKDVFREVIILLLFFCFALFITVRLFVAVYPRCLRA